MVGPGHLAANVRLRRFAIFDRSRVNVQWRYGRELSECPPLRIEFALVGAQIIPSPPFPLIKRHLAVPVIKFGRIPIRCDGHEYNGAYIATLVSPFGLLDDPVEQSDTD
jgi:hypothetical protein